MNRFEAWTIHLSVFLVGGTGAVYAAMLYLLEPIDEFAVIHHPLQPQTQHAHVWFAPVLVFGVGLIWRQHVWRHFRSLRPQRRRSGLALLAAVAPMVISGYLIQTSVGAVWRTTWIAVHLATSALFLTGYAAHLLAAVRSRRRSSERAGAAAPDSGRA